MRWGILMAAAMSVGIHAAIAGIPLPKAPRPKHSSAPLKVYIRTPYRTNAGRVNSTKGPTVRAQKSLDASKGAPFHSPPKPRLERPKKLTSKIPQKIKRKKGVTGNRPSPEKTPLARDKRPLSKPREEPSRTTSGQPKVRTSIPKGPPQAERTQEREAVQSRPHMGAAASDEGSTSNNEEMASPGPRNGPSVRDEPPQYLYSPPPEYPSLAKRRGYEGITELLVQVMRDGTVGSVEVIRSSGHDVLDRSATEAVRRWRFVPAKSNGRPVEIKVRVPVRFVLR